MARVLVVEDQVENRDLMVYLLRAFGHDVATAVDGAEGFAAARRDRPDLMVIDIHMPVMDGVELVAALKADPGLAAVPAVGVTALAMVGDREKVISAGFDGYIDKPISPESFKQQVESFMER